MNPGILHAGWEAPPGVQALCTLRTGGVSAPPWDSLNLGAHVGDDPGSVTENRRRVAAALGLPREPAWLDQEHGVRVADLDQSSEPGPADAAITREPGRVLAILVADCMPVLLAGEDGAVLAAAHAGWRGLSAGVLEATVAAMRTEARGIRAWLGPAIGAAHFEVGAEVREAFTAHAAEAAAAFAPNPRGRWQCDLAWLARARLAALGVQRVWNAAVCTYADRQRCFSYRRDGRTGRMAALIWRAGAEGASGT
jgi:YfiH family protein